MGDIMKDLTVIRKLLENPLKLGKEFSRKTIKPRTVLDLLAYYPNMVYHLSDSKYGKLLFNNPKAVAKQAEKELIEKIIQKYRLKITCIPYLQYLVFFSFSRHTRPISIPVTKTPS